MDDLQIIEELDELLNELREENKNRPIIVEGEKDIAAFTQGLR